MKKVPVALAVFVLAAAVSSSVRAQQAEAANENEARSAVKRTQGTKATDLDRVIVTGIRALKATDKIPGAISIITPEETKQSLIITEDNTAVLARTIPGYAESSQAMTSSAIRESDGETHDHDEKINGYTLWDLGVNYDSGRLGRFAVGLDNLFNKYYILSGSQSDGWQNYWAGRGRVVALSYPYTFR